MNTATFDRRLLLRSAAILTLVAATLLAWQSAIAGPQYLTDDLAIGGYDAVGSFESRDAVKGDPRFAHDWNGATWQFASTANRDRFAADPQAYAPQYDGYCAYAAAFQSKAHGDPEVWEIVDGKLYLNLSNGAGGATSRASSAGPTPPGRRSIRSIRPSLPLAQAAGWPESHSTCVLPELDPGTHLSARAGSEPSPH